MSREGPPPFDADLAAWGKVVVIETRGRRSGLWRRAAVGFVLDADGSIRVAASDDDTHWALNLMADPNCIVELEGVRREHRAERLDGSERHATAVALIMKYGAPAERLGPGPAFRLVPTGAAAADGGPHPVRATTLPTSPD